MDTCTYRSESPERLLLLVNQNPPSVEHLELQVFEIVLKTDISECWYCYLRGSHRLNGSIFTATNQTTLGRDPQKTLFLVLSFVK